MTSGYAGRTAVAGMCSCHGSDQGDTDLVARLVGRLWRLRDLGRFELLGWARRVVALPGAAEHSDLG